MPMICLVMVLIERLKSRNGNQNLPKKLMDLLLGYLTRGVEHINIKHEMPDFIEMMKKGLGIGTQPEKVLIQ
jgi:hypothetical protein